jgi:phosphohistidine phosphatase
VSHTLLLIRHAKAVHDPMPDERRPLAPRGVIDARAAGEWIREHGLAPDYVVLSPSRRTVQTWGTAAESLTDVPTPVVDDRIYHEGSESLLGVLRDVPEDADTVVMVGHNPSTHGLALALDAGGGNKQARAELESRFPTSGIAVFTVSGRWAELDEGGAVLRDFAVPRG